MPLDVSGDLADFAVEPNGTMDVLEPPNRGGLRRSGRGPAARDDEQRREGERVQASAYLHWNLGSSTPSDGITRLPAGWWESAAGFWPMIAPISSQFEVSV